MNTNQTYEAGIDNAEQASFLLARTPYTVNALLRELPEFWILQNEGGSTWNCLGVISHLLYCEHHDWMVRAKTLLAFGETKTFEPLDRLAHSREYQGKSLPELLDAFAAARSANLSELNALNLQPKAFSLKGRHPTFGSVTLSQLLATWVAHDLTHLHQLSRILANRYREAVGPWKQYLGVLQCAGHSQP